MYTHESIHLGTNEILLNELYTIGKHLDTLDSYMNREHFDYSQLYTSILNELYSRGTTMGEIENSLHILSYLEELIN